MKIGTMLYVKTRAEWRAWLRKNYKTAPDIWLIYYKKASNKPRIPYNDAVEEALCFGWIDSIVKGIDEEKYVQRFSPRKSKTPYSQTNKERLNRLIAQKKVIKAVLETIDTKAAGRFKTPPDIMAAIKAHPDAWKHYRRFSPRYKRIRVAFIDGARARPAEFQKRLRYFVKMTAQNKRYGFGNEEYR